MNGIVKIHGKNYKTVALRVSEFKKDHPKWSIETDIISSAEAVVMKAVIKDEAGRIMGNGYAEEVRGSTNINKTSALENAETSAIGRALASVGYGGEEYASANEVSDAIINQKVLESREWYISMNACIRDCLESIVAIKRHLAEDDMESAAEAWFELTDDEKRGLWIAPSKGGMFTTQEREIIKSKGFRESYNNFEGRDEGND